MTYAKDMDENSENRGTKHILLEAIKRKDLILLIFLIFWNLTSNM